jgi:FkbM family methyltransferase
LDVGALHGVFSLAFASDVKEAVAVDASPIAYARLRHNARVNPTLRLSTVECALSDHAGSLPMHYEWEHAVAAKTEEPSISVPCMMGDTLCAEHQFQPDVIKIDVEGHEAKVLRGLDKTLATCHPLLFIELHPELLRQEGDDVGHVIAELHRKSYRGVDVHGSPLPDPLVEITRSVWTADGS